MISQAFGAQAPQVNDDFAYSASLLAQSPRRMPGEPRRITATATAAVTTPSQVGGSHYAAMAIDPFTYGMKNNLDPLQFSVVKYVSRFKSKNGLEDLLKARDCVDRLIQHHYPQGKK